MIGRSPRALRDWSRKKRDGMSLARPRGRPAIRSSRNERQALLASFRELGPHCGVAVYQAMHGALPRAEVKDMVERSREVWRHRNPNDSVRLQWTKLGSVWAVDHSHIPGASKRERIAISCRDLASHEQLLWQHSRETANVTVAQLRDAFEEHGAPLALKADGGPSFRSEELLELLDEHGTELLPSPPYYPQYNGSCEAANQSMKKRSRFIAESNDRVDSWLVWDLELARLQANHTARPWGVNGPVPNDRWLARRPITAHERARFRASCDRHRQTVIEDLGLLPEHIEREFMARSVQRAAVSRALVEHGLLIVQRRVVRPPIHTIRTA